MSSHEPFISVHNRSKKHARQAKRPQKCRPARDVFGLVEPWDHFDISGWGAPEKSTTVTKGWEIQGRVDRLHSLVPYWQQGVLDADQGGEPGRMEDFFIKCEEEDRLSGWGFSGEQNDPWSGAEFPGWGNTVSREPEDKYGWGVGAQDGSSSKPQAKGLSPRVSSDSRPIAPGDAATETPQATASDKTARSNEWEVGGDREIARPVAPTEQAGKSWEFVEKVARQRHASPERKQQMHQFYAMPTGDKVRKIQDIVAFLHAHT